MLGPGLEPATSHIGSSNVWHLDAMFGIKQSASVSVVRQNCCLVSDTLLDGDGPSHVPGPRLTDDWQSGDHRVAQIVRKMEKNVTLMEDNPLSEQQRV